MVSGGYFGGEGEWLRLEKAMRLDASAAIRAASWGRFQILGTHYTLCNYTSPQAYMNAMKISESYHLNCLVKFLKANRLVMPLNAHDWKTFAAAYNGPLYYIHHYDVSLANAYARAVSNGE